MKNQAFHPFPTLKTARLTLRQLESGDDHELFILRSNEAVNASVGREPAKSIEDARVFIQAMAEKVRKHEGLYWAITPKHRLVGTVCLFNFSGNAGTAEVGYELLPEQQGKGIMREALKEVMAFGFQTLQLQAIEAYTRPDNRSSVKLLEKLGFKLRQGPDKTTEDFAVYRLTGTDSIQLPG